MGIRREERWSLDTFNDWLLEQDHVDVHVPVELWVPDIPTEQSEDAGTAPRLDMYEEYVPESAQPERYGLEQYLPDVSLQAVTDTVATYTPSGGSSELTVALEDLAGETAQDELSRFDDRYELQSPRMTTGRIRDKPQGATVPVTDSETGQTYDVDIGVRTLDGTDTDDILDATVGWVSRAIEQAHDRVREYVTPVGVDGAPIDTTHAGALLWCTEEVKGKTAGMYGVPRDLPVYLVDTESRWIDDPVFSLLSKSTTPGYQAARSLYWFNEEHTVDETVAAVTRNDDTVSYRIEADVTATIPSINRERTFTVPVVFTGETSYDALPAETQAYLDAFDGIDTDQPQASDYLPMLDS